MRERFLLPLLVPLVTVALTLAAIEGLSRWMVNRDMTLRPFGVKNVPPPGPHALPETLNRERRFEKPYVPQPPNRIENDFPYDKIESNTNWSLPKNLSAVVHYSDQSTGAVVWETKFTTDRHGRRVPSWQRDRARTATWHVFGITCSYTLGFGLSDDETFLARLSANATDVITYNAGMQGASIGEALIRAQDEDVLDDIEPKRGIGIYTAFLDHLARFMNTANMVGTWREKGLSLREEPRGRFESRGSSLEADPVWTAFAKLWARLAFPKAFNLDWPPMTDARADRYVRAILAYRDLYRQKTLPTNPFLVVLYPLSEDATPIIRALERAEIPYLNYSHYSLRDFIKGPQFIPGEHHPTAEASELFAKVLARDLRNALEKEFSASGGR